MRELSIEEKNLIIEDAEGWNLNRKLSDHELVSFSNGPKEFCDIMMDKTLIDIDLSHMVFNDLSFFNTTFGKDVDLSFTTFNWCTFKYGLFENADIKNVMFNKCSINSIWNSKLKSCIFQGCIFPEDITESYLESITIDNCCLRSLRFRYSEIFCSSITNSNLDRVHTKSSKVKNCTFKNVSALRGEFQLSVFKHNFIDFVQTDDYFTPLFCVERNNKIA